MTKTTKKLIALLLAVVMITTLISPSNYSWISAAEARTGNKSATPTDSIALLSDAQNMGEMDKYITGVIIQGADGKVYGSSNANDKIYKLPLDPNDSTKQGTKTQMAMDITFDIDTVNAIIASGEDASFTYKLPDNIKLGSNVYDKPISKDGVQIGSYSVVDGILTTIIFKDKLAENVELEASFSAWVTFDLSKYNEKNEVENKFTSKITVNVPVDFKPDVDLMKSVSNGYTANPDDGYVYFDYTVEVSSKHGTASYEGTTPDLIFKDVISNDLTGVLPDVVNIKVEDPSGNDISSKLSYDSSSATISGTLPNLGAKQSYKVTYTVKSKVGDLGQDVVNLNQKNQADVDNNTVRDSEQTNKSYKYVKDGATDLKLKKSVSNVTADPENRTITFNYNLVISSEYGTDGDIDLNDVISGELDSRLGSNAKRKVQNITVKKKNLNNWQDTVLTDENYVKGPDGDIANDGQVLTGTLPKLDANNQYEISYDIVIYDIDDGVGTVKVNSDNTATADDGKNTSTETSHRDIDYNGGKKTPKVSKKGALSEDGSKITWTITINEDNKKDLTDVTITDIYKKNDNVVDEDKNCDVEINGTASATKISLPANIVLDGDKVYLTDGTNKIELSDRRSKIVLKYETAVTEGEKLTDTYYNEVGITKGTDSDSANDKVEIDNGGVKKKFVGITDGDDSSVLAWKTTISGKITAGSTYSDKIDKKWPDVDRSDHYFTNEQINNIHVGDLVQGTDYKLSYQITEFCGWENQRVVDDLSGISNPYDIMGFVITFLKDVDYADGQTQNIELTYSTTVKTDADNYEAKNDGTFTTSNSSKDVSDSYVVKKKTHGAIVKKYSISNGVDEKSSIVGYVKDDNVFIYKVVLNENFVYGKGDVLDFYDVLPEGTSLDTLYSSEVL